MNHTEVHILQYLFFLDASTNQPMPNLDWVQPALKNQYNLIKA